ncbi:MAG: sugar transferase [Lachnospiraceae bacterium]|nr:sugar transferase [Lachnospiraceae bacterium]
MNKLLDFRKRLGDYQEWFYLPFIIVMGGLMSFGITSEDKIYLICFAVVTLLLGVKVVITDYSLKEITWMVLIGVLLIVNFLINGERTLIVTYMAVIGAKNVDITKTLKLSLWTKLPLTVFRVLLAITGVVENEIIEIPKEGIYVGLTEVKCYGFYSANMLYGNMIVIAMLFFIVYREKAKWYWYVLFTTFFAVAYKYLYCRTGFAIWLGFCFLLALHYILRKTKIGVEFLRFCSFTPYVLMIVTYILTALLSKTYFYMEKNRQSDIDGVAFFQLILKSIVIAVCALVFIVLFLRFTAGKYKKIYGFACDMVAPAMIGGTIWFSWLALNSQKIRTRVLTNIHRSFTGRFHHTRIFYDRTGIGLIGNKIRETFDSVYFHSAYNYGWIITVVFLVAYSAAIWHCVRKKNTFGALALTAMAVYGFLEQFPLSVLWNVPLIYISKVLFEEIGESEETDEEMNSYNKKNQTIETYGFIVINLFSATFAYVAACYLRFWTEGNAIRERGKWFEILMLCLAGSIIYDLISAGYKNFFKRGIFDELVKVVRYILTLFIGISAYIYIFDMEMKFSRLMLGYFIVITGILTFVLRCIFRSVMKAYYWSTGGSDKIMIVSTRERVEKIINNIKRGGEWSYKIIGLVLTDCDMVGESVCGVPIIAELESAAEVGRQSTLDAVIFDCADSNDEKIEAEIKEFLSMGVVVHNCVDVRSMDAPYSSMERFAEMPVVTYSMNMIDYRRRIIKRVMDIVGGLVGIIILIVVTPFVALAIKLDSEGPVFFSQTRIGRNGRRFKMYKFRSMYEDAEERKKELMEKNKMSGPMFKMDDDPRITKVGKFIRKTSIDELPQFWNVLIGDMSLVGTRPPTVEEYEQYSSYYRRRMSFTPGLTGLWQVSGRSDIEDFDEVVKLDLQYIDGWSVRKDIKILIKTIGVVLSRKGSK